METPILGLWSPDNGDGYDLIQDLAAMTTDIENSILNPPKVRITGTTDVSISSTEHPFQIGPDSGLNLRADNNEIQGMNNGSPSQLVLNQEGGDIRLGDATSTTYVTGRINNTHLPWAMAHGVLSVTGLEANTPKSVTVT